jgi:hypothetical protein
MWGDVPWVPIVVVGIVAGGVGGAVGRYTAPAPSHARATAQPDVQADLAAAVERVDTLERRLAAVERAGALAPLRVAAKPVAAPVEADADEPPAPKTARPASTDPVFQAAVRDTVEQLDEERRTARHERSVTRLSGKIAMNDDQRERAVAILDGLSASLRDLREGGEDDPGGARMDALRAKGESMFVELLDHDQRTKYDALDEGDKLTARRGPPGP